jgi:hypothetical protein
MKRVTILPLAAALALMVGCSESGPPPARAGTPEYFFQNALENYNKGDYAKANDWMAKMSKSESETAGKARAWRMVVLGGMLQGYRELADTYELGSKANKDKPGPFFKKTNDYRALAATMAIELSENYDAFLKAVPSGDVQLHFPYPPRGSLARPNTLDRVATGQMPSDSDVEGLVARMLERGILSTAASVVGASGDAAKAQAAFKATPATVPRATFQLAMAKLMHDASSVFGAKKRNESGRQEFVLNRAKLALADADKAAKETKELKDKFDADTKDIAKRKT